MLHAIIEIFAPLGVYAREVYDRVMGNERIGNKLWSYFWRVAGLYAALFGAAFGLVTLLSWGSLWKNIPIAGILGIVITVLIICAVYSLLSFRRMRRKSESAENDL